MIISLPRPRPEQMALEGRYTRLDPLGSAHAEELYASCVGADNRSRFDYLFEPPPESLLDIQEWIVRVSASADPLYFAVIDRASGRCEGRQALMRITPEHGTIELGGIYWGPAVRAAFEAWLDPANFDVEGGQLEPLRN